MTYSTDASWGRGEALGERLTQLDYADVRAYGAGVEDWVGAGLLVETGTAGIANQVPGLWSGLGSVFGLIERVFLGLILLWMLLVSLRAPSVAAARWYSGKTSRRG